MLGGILIGVVAMYAVDRYGSGKNPATDSVVRDIGGGEKLPPDLAEQLRDEQYASVRSIEDIHALPGEFARAEALFVLAGRSDSVATQKLIFEADRIVDDEERVELLEILFFRLSELDPRSALALARTERFAGVRALEQTVWRAWARRDLDDALFAAKTEASIAGRNSAAQNLYAAFGYMNNATTDRIQSELGIGPDRATRGRYLYLLADRSPASAIDFINGIENSTEQTEYISWLAYHLSLRDSNDALRYGVLFTDKDRRDYYEAVVNRSIARENPRATIERILAGDDDDGASSDIHSAMSTLVTSDLDAAMALYEQARTREHRQLMGSPIAEELAKKDPSLALRWARDRELDQFPYLQTAVLSEIAKSDPRLAIAEAIKSPDTQTRGMLVSSLMQNIAHTDPVQAAEYLELFEDPRQKRDASELVTSIWLRDDPDAAVEWILGRDKHTASQLLPSAIMTLAKKDLDAVSRLLPKLNEDLQFSVRQRVVDTITRSHSPEEAQIFIRQFEGQAGYDQLQASVIAGVARRDPLRAKQMADQLAAGDARDRAYLEIIGSHSQTSPVDAAAWLNSITNETLRGAASGQIAANWYSSDPGAAKRWATNMPAGTTRDEVMLQLSSRLIYYNDEPEAFIAEIQDRDKRGQAKIMQIYQIMHTDPARAQKLLQDDDISDAQRQQVQMSMTRGIRGY